MRRLFALSGLVVLVSGCQTLITRAISDAAHSEPRADVFSPRKLQYPEFTVQFPGNWTVDNDNRGASSADQYFRIVTAKKRGHFAILIWNKVLDPTKLLEIKVKAWDDEVHIRDQTAISNWGSYSGSGITLKCVSYSEKCIVRDFFFVSEQRTIEIIQFMEDYYFSDDSGFALIERTFRVLARPAPVERTSQGPLPQAMAERAAEFQRRAKSDFEAERWIDAAAEFERAYMINHDSALLFNMALCHRKAGSARRALDLYKRYLSLVPDSPKREDIEGRIRELRQQLVVVEPQAKAHYEVATRLYSERKYGEAVAEFEKALVLTQDATMLFNIGQAYRLWDRPRDAISAYRGYVRRAPAAGNRAVVEKTIAYLERVVDDRHLGLPPQQPTEPIQGEQEILPPAASEPATFGPAGGP